MKLVDTPTDGHKWVQVESAAKRIIDRALFQEAVDDFDFDSYFQRYAPQARQVITEVPGVHLVGVEGMRYPAMYAPPSTVYLSGKLKESASFALKVLAHECGHVYRDRTAGPIYNYYLCKDTAGNPVAEEEAARRIVIEENEATNWANEQFRRIGFSKMVPSFPADTQRYIGWIQQIRSKGIDTTEGLIRFFANMAGFRV